MHARPFARIGAVILVCLVSLSAALLAMTARSQGITATAKPLSVSTSADVAAMKRLVDELERRVEELEKESADEAEADKDEVAVDKTMEQRLAALETAPKSKAPSDDAGDQDLEQRLAALETARRDESAGDNAGDQKLEQRLAAVETAQQNKAAGNKDAQRAGSTLTSGPQRLRAPFVVVDDRGIALVTIDRSEISGSARLTVGDPKGSSVVIAAKSDTAIVQLIADQTGKPKVWIAVDPNHQGMKAIGPNGSTWVGSSNEKVAVVQVLNNDGYPVAEMRGLPVSQGGQMSIANASGKILMIAQETEKGVGALSLGPASYGVASAMQNQGLPAGSLLGKKE